MKIALAALHPSRHGPLAAFLHRRLGASLAQVQRQLALGRSGVFYACALYGNDHVQRDAEITDILAAAGDHGVALHAWEADADVPLPARGIDGWVPLEMAHLLNLLEAARGRYA